MRTLRPGQKIINIGGSNRYQHGKISGAVSVTYLLRDEFTTDESAPLSNPRTCEPGPGTLTINTPAALSISGGILYNSAATLIYDNETITRQAGMAVAGKFVPHNQPRMDFEFGFATSVSVPRHSGFFVQYANISYQDNNAGAIIYTASGNTHTLEYVVILRSAGAFYLLKGDNLPSWTHVYVGATAATSSLRFTADDTFVGGLYAQGIDYLRRFQLAAPWTDYGIVTQRLDGARSVGDTFAHEADCLIEFEVDTIPSGDQIELRFRVQDANNYWQVTIDASGNLDLDEVVSGSATQRGTSAGVIANSDRIVIVANDTTIRVYEANNLRVTYASATNFKTDTSGELETEGTGGAVSEIVSWPRTLSGAALLALEAI